MCSSSAHELSRATQPPIQMSFWLSKKTVYRNAITLSIDKIRKAMDKGQMTGAIFVDLSKAFDTISHVSIINKLPSYGLCETSQQWITSYLFARTQCVSYKGTLSSPSYIYCNVPQDSILGPPLFLLHFNDSVECLSTRNMLMYADDTVIYFSDSNINSIQNNLQRDFQSLSKYLYNNELIMNLKKGKTEIMRFVTNQRIRRIEKSTLHIQHNDLTVNMTYSHKYLGVTLTSSLNMTDHLNATIKKASPRIHLLKKIRSHMDSKTAKLIYQSMIVPILTYCPLSLYGSIPPYLKNRINAMEARAQLIISNENEVAKSEIINKKRS